MSNKRFSERLNRELDEIGVPPQQKERVAILAKLVNATPYKAQDILNGNIASTSPYIQILADEFEVSSEWLWGKSDKKH